jgi:hypothetical protein
VELARKSSAGAWNESDVWTSAALIAAGGSAATALPRLVKQAEGLLSSIKVSLYRGIARAMTASHLVESHKHEFHGFGDVRHGKICFLVPEEGEADSSPFVASLAALPRGTVEVAVYFASGDKVDNPSVRRRYFAKAVSSNLRLRRVLCGGKNVSLSDCAADQCLMDGYGYWIPARHDWVVSGSQHWSSELIRGFKTRADMGVARLSIGGAAKALAFSRGHVRVFGAAVDLGVDWAGKVYGNEFVWDLPAAKLSISGDLKVVQERDSLADAILWHEHLCREQKWCRYCSKVDTAYFARQPHPHSEVSLTRAEFEAMEQAAKAGHVADMGQILEAQRAAQEAGRARQEKRRRDKAKMAATEKELLRQYSGEEVALSNWAIRWGILTLLYARSEKRVPWPELKRWSSEMVLKRAAVLVARFAEANRLRVALENLTDKLIVLPNGDDELRAEAVWVLNNVSTALGEEIAGEGLTMLQLREALEGIWPHVRRKSLPLFGAHTSELADADVDNRKKRPCVVDSVVVPEPWFAYYADEEISNECYSSKRNGEKCCDYTAKDEMFCVAAFHGHEAKNMRSWLRLCESLHWGKSSVSDNDTQCRWAGVVVPMPWYRRADMPASVCFAPKEPAERCCDLTDDGKNCVVRFDGYSAQAVADWMKGCRGKHWVL